jgi:ADP-ribose pyrophosphatase YjhB (NUDIX family)
MSTQQDLALIADKLQTLANLGTKYSEDSYDLDRYHEIRSLSAQILGLAEARPADEVLVKLKDNISHVCPLLGSEAAVFRDNRLLLIKRHDDGLWAMPGGLAEVGETWAIAAERELWEEACVRGKASKLIGIFDSKIWKEGSNVHMHMAVFLVESDHPSPSVTAEATEVGFFGEHDLPPLTPGHHIRVPFIFKLIGGEEEMPFFDRTASDID